MCTDLMIHVDMRHRAAEQQRYYVLIELDRRTHTEVMCSELETCTHTNVAQITCIERKRYMYTHRCKTSNVY